MTTTDMHLHLPTHYAGIEGTRFYRGKHGGWYRDKTVDNVVLRFLVKLLLGVGLIVKSLVVIGAAFFFVPLHFFLEAFNRRGFVYNGRIQKWKRAFEKK